MKIALICPSNRLYMPYVGNYMEILDRNNIEYDVINWDRFNIEDGNDNLIYRDSKVGHGRNILDYYEYKKFVYKNLQDQSYDKVIIFGIQLSFFLKNILIKDFYGNYIVDIRDYHRAIKFFNIQKLIEGSVFTVLSSPGFKEWLPNSKKYIINHNTKIENLDEMKEIKIEWLDKEKINISYIGSIRDYDLNIDFIESLKNKDNINLKFHGEGIVNKDMSKYLEENSIKNVILTGRYEKKDEDDLFLDSDLINILIPNDNINSKTLLPNRLYNSVINGVPIITSHGTNVSKQIERYKLGIVLESFENIERDINDYMEDFDIDLYEKSRINFMEDVIEENNLFVKELLDFVES